MPGMGTALALGGGVAWTIAYLLIIWHGFADRTYGMPLVALGANLSWEFIFSFVHPSDQPQRTVNVVWLLFDLVILVTAVRFGAREFPGLPRLLYLGGLGGILVLSYLGVLLFANEFDTGGAVYVAFAQNLLMSGLFLSMLWSRWLRRADESPLRGQSVWIGVAKLVGTAFASAMAYFTLPSYSGSALLGYLYLTILLLDAAYVVALVVVARKVVAMR
ncbi:hypothetical protein GCM10027569_12140 [Flindersiella endophytica]